MKTVRITLFVLSLCAFAVAVVFLVRERRRTERLDAVCGVWIASDSRSTLRIDRYGGRYLIVVKCLTDMAVSVKCATNFSTGAVSAIGTPRASGLICLQHRVKMHC